jgi:hypothetical protein
MKFITRFRLTWLFNKMMIEIIHRDKSGEFLSFMDEVKKVNK